MINIEDSSYQPDIFQIKEYVENAAFDALYEYMESEYAALCKIEYSGDKVLLGWNVKYRKAGKTLCTVYPRKGFFSLLLVVGKKEKARVEALLCEFSEEFRRIYESTQEGMGQRWLLFNLSERGALYSDILKVVRIRRING